MQVILIDKIDSLGDVGQIVHVRSGYARNFLIPQSKAVLATKENIASFKKRHVRLENELVQLRSEARERIARIKNFGVVVIPSKSGVEGKLFGSIGARMIANVITELGVKVSKKNIRLPHGIIRSLGDYDVVIQICCGVSTVLKVSVV